MKAAGIEHSRRTQSLLAAKLPTEMMSYYYCGSR